MSRSQKTHQSFGYKIRELKTKKKKLVLKSSISGKDHNITSILSFIFYPSLFLLSRSLSVSIFLSLFVPLILVSFLSLTYYVYIPDSRGKDLDLDYESRYLT